ncbi:hypothetical protein DAPPUDRAFT_249145 [Daphnia pulex]|uniref:Uncharacterized protein n=1 Tax=Daphnia pulex TaxID=6669 RepID=E9GVY9_DAPPU|nr:hypothetical protein DAPPUDRAFT_249145 [Daphnia pulex]|eukprot:EFX76363.1 hypothetical protein DAPPUDRAFT_249145 [Daphnia pulex]
MVLLVESSMRKAVVPPPNRNILYQPTLFSILTLDGRHQTYVNQYTSNPLVASKHQASEERRCKCYLSLKFPVTKPLSPPSYQRNKVSGRTLCKAGNMGMDCKTVREVASYLITSSREESDEDLMKMVSTRQCSPSESIETSDTESGSPAMEFQVNSGMDSMPVSSRTSSTESDSMPFANDNAGTIKQRSARAHPALAALTYSSSSVAAVLSPSLGRRAPSTSNANTNINLGQHCTPVS